MFIVLISMHLSVTPTLNKIVEISATQNWMGLSKYQMLLALGWHFAAQDHFHCAASVIFTTLSAFLHFNSPLYEQFFASLSIGSIVEFIENARNYRPVPTVFGLILSRSLQLPKTIVNTPMRLYTPCLIRLRGNKHAIRTTASNTESDLLYVYCFNSFNSFMR